MLDLAGLPWIDGQSVLWVLVQVQTQPDYVRSGCPVNPILLALAWNSLHNISCVTTLISKIFSDLESRSEKLYNELQFNSFGWLWKLSKNVLYCAISHAALLRLEKFFQIWNLEAKTFSMSYYSTFTFKVILRSWQTLTLMTWWPWNLVYFDWLSKD